MADSFFTVGDTIQLTGSDWEHYCSKPLFNQFREVLEVDDKGVAMFICVQYGGEGYMAWASPREADGLFAIVVNENPPTDFDLEAL